MNLTNSSTVIDQGGPVGSLREALIGAWQLWEVLRRSTSAFVITIGHCPYVLVDVHMGQSCSLPGILMKQSISFAALSSQGLRLVSTA
jgi:hypothetical protein